MTEMQSTNLAPHRGPSVWDRDTMTTSGRPTAADWLASGSTNRWVAGIVGGMLALSGLRRRGPAGALMAIAGGTLAARAISGTDDVATLRGALSRFGGTTRVPSAVDAVDDANDESFPASDAPSWTSSAAIGRCDVNVRE